MCLFISGAKHSNQLVPLSATLNSECLFHRPPSVMSPSSPAGEVLPLLHPRLQPSITSQPSLFLLLSHNTTMDSSWQIGPGQLGPGPDCLGPICPLF